MEGDAGEKEVAEDGLAGVHLLAHAVNLTWDVNTGLAGAQDGSGTWDTNTANWWNGTSDVAFNNNTPDAAFFGAAGGTAGTVTLGTNVTPFGITFNADATGIWYFFNPTLAVGNFAMRAEASQWRKTQCVTLNYETAALPGPVRDILYDEVRVLSENHCLGIGGFKGPAGDGDNFYFLLTRL